MIQLNHKEIPYKSPEKINHRMYIDEIKVFAKKWKVFETDANYKNI